LAHIREMGTRVDRALLFLMSVITAAITALALALVAHFDFGLSREEIRSAAMVGAGVVTMLVAVEFFGKKLRKLK
jgi:membrane protease YdiL (CAAX protease family)